MATIGQPRAMHKNIPKKTAPVRNNPPRAITCLKDISPVPVRRLGPVRATPSAPFLPSTASLKKFVAIWTQSAPSKVQLHSQLSKFPVSFHANTPPNQPGTMPAAKVFGLAPEATAFINFPKLITCPKFKSENH
jgi:hypothetical protein